MTTGLIKPSTDFRAVRDGRNSQVFYVDVALDTSRSASAGTALVLPISGNSFYIDANPSDGNALVHFQDTNFDRGPAPLYVSPGAIFNIPFTQVLIENTAQAGKKIRIAYGIDVDFQPGSVSQIAVTNNGGFTAVRPETNTNFYNVSAALAINTAEQVIAPVANVNGAIILTATHVGMETGVNVITHLLAKSSPPISMADGQVIAASTFVNSGPHCLFLPEAQKIAPGQGLYFMVSQNPVTTASFRTCRYILL